MSKPHKKLVAWLKSMDLVEKIYALTKEFPREELYGLSSQMRRAAISAPSNIAEGAGGSICDSVSKLSERGDRFPKRIINSA